MHPSASDKGEFRRLRDGVVDVLGDPRLQEDLERAAQQIPGPGTPREKVTRELNLAPADTESSGGGPAQVPYFARAPLPSLVQSHIEQALDEGIDRDYPQSLWSRLVHSIEHAIDRAAGSFTPDDPDWFVFIAKGVLEHLARGNAPFNPHPAERDLSDNARLVLVGDWGTGLQRARDVASHMHQHVASALDEGRQVHAIHLGDVYYSGLPDEDQRHFLEWWPVTQAQAEAGVMSWSLNGNHDMYSGGFGYFETLLADPRFGVQRSHDGRATSFFRLKGNAWEFVGLDTAWDSDVMSFGAAGVLEDPQGHYVAEIADASDHKLVLMSHHQLVSVYDTHDLDQTLPDKLHTVLAANRVTAWWWGHEHRAITYDAADGVHYPRCLGNGGVPTAPDPDPPAGSSPTITWHSTRTTVENGSRWTRSGFAVLDLHDDHIDVQYVDDDGFVARTETVS